MVMSRMPAVLDGSRFYGALPSRLLPWAAACALTVVWVLDLVHVHDNFSQENWLGPPHSAMDYVPVVSGALVCVLTAVALRPKSGPALTTVLGTAAAGTVLAASAALWPLPMGEAFGYFFMNSEILGLLVLLVLTGFRCRPWQIGLVALCAGAVPFSDHLRESTPYYEGLVYTTLVFLAAGVSPGLYLRWREAQRRVHTDRARAQERLSIARDLHDVVAHEVTGIVVQVQALRYIADRDPDAVRAALPDIEASGARALESMRGMVSRLRDPGEAPLAPDPAEGLARLASPAADGRPEVTVLCEGSVDELPPTVGTAVLRIAQESVTNALRHARGATRVRVVVEAGPDGARTEVCDDGRGTGGPTGGYGLVGMAERVRLLGGRFSAGPREGEPGWRVRAWLPSAEAGGAREVLVADRGRG